MSTRELRRVEVFSRVQSEALRLVDAAEMLALSYRQTKRLWRRYRLEGASGLQHGPAHLQRNCWSGDHVPDYQQVERLPV